MLGNLNESQKMAVECVNGPVIVFAGAGSGKTRTLTHRIAYMINDVKINPYNILAITFTNKATNEMRERLLNLVGPDSKRVTISTFHALCARILRVDINKIGYDTHFSIVDEDDQLKIISDCLSEAKEEKRKARGLQKRINYFKSFNIEGSEDPFENKIWQAYEKKMKLLNLLDFEDLLLKVKELFETKEEILKKYQKKYQYVLVDEFQDTSLVQYKIVRLLCKESRNLFVVGDDDQSIYSFRGANYENMVMFKREFSEYQSFTLTQNYRSTQSILNGSNRLIKNNVEREKKELFSDKVGEKSDVQVYQAESEKNEVDYVIDNILTLKNSTNSFTDFAILYRSSVILRNFELGLIRMGLPYRVFGGISYMKRKEVKDVIAYLKLVIDNNDFYSFSRIINIPGRGIGPSTVDKINTIKNEYNLTLFETIDSCISILPKSKFLVLKEFKDMIKGFSDLINEMNLISFFDMILEKTKYKEYVKEEYPDDYEDRNDNIDEFKSILYQIETTATDETRADCLRGAFDHAMLSDEYTQNQKENKFGVTVSTIHSIKGLEFDYVFVVGLEENVFPNNFRIQNKNELEEERRIAYVAVTRAKKKLFLTATKRRMLYGSFFDNQPSRFLLEFLGTTLDSFNDKEKSVKKSSKNTEYHFDDLQYENIDKKKDTPTLNSGLPINYKVGDKVLHNKFGEGLIVSIDGEIGQIFFASEKKITKILLTHPALRKI